MPTRASEWDRHERRHHRHDVTRFVWYHSIEAPGTQLLEGLSYCVDVSRGGIGFVSKERIPVGTLLMVEIVFDSQRYTLPAVCRMVYSSKLPDGLFSCGAEFVVLPPDARQFLADRYG